MYGFGSQRTSTVQGWVMGERKVGPRCVGVGCQGGS